MSEISDNLIKIKKELPSSVKLIAVSKTRSVEEIMEAYNAGHRQFGENRVQELLSKKDHLPGDIEWHLIGHLQSNKVKLIAPFISMIHSIDSLKLLAVTDNEAEKAKKIIDCLVQIHIAEEETKFGFSMDELRDMLKSDAFRNFRSVRMCGVMGMATFTDDMVQVRKEFAFLKKCFDEIKADYFTGSSHFREISMGMSGDYSIATEEGSTMVRLGSIIFGERTYAD
jgi:pyridoxal phosphate enzyme (YggS family)